MLQPWALHPYQYVDQNPIAYWDPDGKEKESEGLCYVSGKEPVDSGGQAVGPYFYGAEHPNSEDKAGGLQFGMGVLNGRIAPGVTASAVHADVAIGKFTDSSGEINYGVNAEAGLARVSFAPTADRPIGFETGAMNANVSAYVNKSGAVAGAEANFFDLAYTVGTPSNNVSAGVIVGVGVSARLHWEMTSSGERSVGFGVNGELGIGGHFDVQTTALSSLITPVEAAMNPSYAMSLLPWQRSPDMP
jgi:hypothetical protein